MPLTDAQVKKINADEAERHQQEDAETIKARRDYEEGQAFIQFISEHSGSSAVRRFLSGDKAAVFDGRESNLKVFRKYCLDKNYDLTDPRALDTAFRKAVSAGLLFEYQMPKAEYERRTDLSVSRVAPQGNRTPGMPVLPAPFTRNQLLSMPKKELERAVRKYGNDAINLVLASNS
jgi:hypothetical protein